MSPYWASDLLLDVGGGKKSIARRLTCAPQLPIRSGARAPDCRIDVVERGWFSDTPGFRAATFAPR